MTKEQIPHKTREGIALFGVYLLLLILLCLRAYVGWIPWDDGTMGQAAMRVAAGQTPHVDFIDTHTGLLSYFHAWLFQHSSPSLAVLRTAILIAWIVTSGAILLLLRQMCSNTLCGVFLSACLLLGPAAHVAPLPSSYNSLLAIWGVLALWYYFRTQSSILLFISGCIAGVSFLIKVSGLFLLAGVLASLLYAQQERSLLSVDKDSEKVGSAMSNHLLYSLVVTAALFCVLFFLHNLLHSHISLVVVVNYYIPITCIVLFLMWRQWCQLPKSQPSAILRTNTKAFVIESFTVLAGFLLPLLLFFSIHYQDLRLLRAWFQGVFIIPQTRLQHASWFGISPAYVLAVLILFLVCAYLVKHLRTNRALTIFSTIWCIAFSVFPFLESGKPHFSVLVWYALQFPTVILALRVLHASTSLSTLEKKKIFLLAAVFAFHSLIQFPYFNQIYLYHTLPLHFLVLAALHQVVSIGGRHILLASVVATIPLGLKLSSDSGVVILPRLVEQSNYSLLSIPTGGIYLSPSAAQLYTNLVRQIQSKASGNPILALPDCPEVHFLSALDNPLATMFDFFDDRTTTEKLSDIKEVIATRDVKVVIINNAPGFSGELAPEVATYLRQKFPMSSTYARYEVRWKED